MSYYTVSYRICKGTESAPELDVETIQPLLNSRIGTSKLPAGGNVHEVYAAIEQVLKECSAGSVSFLLCIQRGAFPCLPLKRSNSSLQSFLPGKSEPITGEDDDGGKNLGSITILLAPLGFTNVSKLNNFIKAFSQQQNAGYLTQIADTMVYQQTVLLPKLGNTPLSRLQVFEHAIRLEPENPVHLNNCSLRMDFDAKVKVGKDKEKEEWGRKELLAKAISLKPGQGVYYANMALMGVRSAKHYPLTEEELQNPQLSVSLQGKQMSQVDLCIKSIELPGGGNFSWNNLSYYLPPAADAEPFLRNFCYHGVTNEFMGFPIRDLVNPVVSVQGKNYTKRQLIEKACELSPSMKNVYNHSGCYLLRIFEDTAAKVIASAEGNQRGEYNADIWFHNKDTNTLNMAGNKMNAVDILGKALNLDNKYYNSFDSAAIALFHEDQANAVAAKAKGLTEVPPPATILVNGISYDSFGCLVEAIRYLPTIAQAALGTQQWPASPLLHFGTALYQRERAKLASKSGGQAASMTEQVTINGTVYTWQLCFTRANKYDTVRTDEYLTAFLGAEWKKMVGLDK